MLIGSGMGVEVGSCVAVDATAGGVVDASNAVGTVGVADGSLSGGAPQPDIKTIPTTTKRIRLMANQDYDAVKGARLTTGLYANSGRSRV